VEVGVAEKRRIGYRSITEITLVQYVNIIGGFQRLPFLMVCCLLAMLLMTNCMYRKKKTHFEMTDLWRIQQGDSLNWSDLFYNHLDWERIKINGPWEEQGLQDYNGYAWYRSNVFLPKSWSRDKDILVPGYAVVHLGRIADVDAVYFNGELIGQTGAFPPDPVLQTDIIREYKVPARFIFAGKHNVVAVRVWNAEGKGGLYEGVPHIRIPYSGW
jgi:hypothetical protein